MFPFSRDLEEQAAGFIGSRVMFGRVVEVTDPFSITVSVEDLELTDVPIPNPHPLVSGERANPADAGDVVMLLQFIDGTVICFGRVGV